MLNNFKKIKGAADKNGMKNVTCKRTLNDKIGPWDLCWFKRLKIDLLCFFAIGCNFVNLLLANLNCEQVVT